MKLNWAEKCVVNNPLRVLQQRVEVGWLKGKMPLEEGAEVLEVGCGRGAGAKLILEAFRPSFLYALDLDIHMIRKAKTFHGLRKHGKVELVVGDVLHLPFEDHSMDALFGFGFLHHIVNWRSALSEIARVLKIGGVYYIEELYPALYQNVITKRILFHPRTDRFHSSDLQQELLRVKIPIKATLEHKKLGILAVAVREK